MLRLRHLALIFLFLSPAMAADEIALEGSALLDDKDRAGGYRPIIFTPNGPLLNTFPKHVKEIAFS